MRWIGMAALALLLGLAGCNGMEQGTMGASPAAQSNGGGGGGGGGGY